MHYRSIPLLILPLLTLASPAFGQEDQAFDETGAALEVAESDVQPGVEVVEELDCAAPCLTYGLSLELQSDAVVSARPSSDTGIDTGLSADLELSFAATDQLNIVSVITGETISDWEPGRDRALRDLGIFVGALYAEYTSDPLTVHAGKFDPGFGLGAAQLEGLFAAGLSDAYDTDERLGVEATLVFPGDRLSYAVTASFFTTDRTALSRSLGYDRGRLTLDDGGAGNVRGIGSAAIFYDVCSGANPEDCFVDGDFGGRLGVRYQKAGRADEDQIAEGISPGDELGYLGAAMTRVPLSGDLDLRLLGELAYFRNFEGGADDALVATGSLGVEIGALTYAATYSMQRNFIAGDADTTDHILGVSGRYDLGDIGVFRGQDWTFDAGYQYARTGGGTHDHKVGLALTVAFAGARPFR